MMYAYYSKKQFDIISKGDGKVRRPYLYYKLEDGSIVQVTEVSTTKTVSGFHDAVFVGMVTEFYKASEEPLYT